MSDPSVETSTLRSAPDTDNRCGAGGSMMNRDARDGAAGRREAIAQAAAAAMALATTAAANAATTRARLTAEGVTPVRCGLTSDGSLNTNVAAPMSASRA